MKTKIEQLIKMNEEKVAKLDAEFWNTSDLNLCSVIFTERMQLILANKELLKILNEVTVSEGKFCECEIPKYNYPEMIWCDNCGKEIYKKAKFRREN